MRKWSGVTVVLRMRFRSVNSFEERSEKLQIYVLRKCTGFGCSFVLWLFLRSVGDILSGVSIFAQ